MDDRWKLTDRGFSREWRRGKDYRLSEIKHLARRRGCFVRAAGRGAVEVVNTKTRKVVAHFRQIVQDDAPKIDERLAVYANLKTGHP